MNATFSSSNFPNVTDISITEVPSYVSGDPYFIKKEVSLDGFITGFVSGSGVAFTEFLPSYKTGSLSLEDYTISGLTFDSISYADSDYDIVQPYNAKFSSYDNSGFLDISDEWQYEENDNKILSIRHKVSARSELPVTGDSGSIPPRVIAFVRSKASGQPIIPPNGAEYSTFNGITKVGVEEVSDVVLGSYSLTNSYQAYREGAFYGTDARINKVSLNINYDRPSEKLSISAEGSSVGPVLSGLYTGTAAPSGFDPDDIIQDISDFVVNSVDSLAEGYSLEDVYSVGSSFTVSPEENKIEFSCDFEQVPSGSLIGEGKNVLHTYETSFNIDKISQPYVTCSINGSLTYAGVDNPLTGQDLLTSARWNAITNAFTGLDLEAAVTTDLTSFTSNIGVKYKLGTKIPSGVSNPKGFTINKSLESLSLDYSYEYSTKEELGSGVYNNLNIKTDKSLPIDETGIVETINGFSTGYNGKKAGTITVSASAENSKTFMSGLKALAFEKIGTGGFFVKDSSEDEGDNNISFSVSKYYL